MSRSSLETRTSARTNRMLRNSAPGEAETATPSQPALQPNSLCPGPCLEASADTFIYQGVYAPLFRPVTEMPHVVEGMEPGNFVHFGHHNRVMIEAQKRFRAVIDKLKAAASNEKLQKTIEDNLPKAHEALFELGVLFRERIRTRPLGYTIERAPFYEISIPPGDMVTLTQRSFSRRSRTLQEELASESEQKLELSSSFTTEMNDELTRVIENSSQWSEGTSASAGIGYSIYSASLGYTNSTNVSQMDTETAKKMRRVVEESVRKIESRQKSSHKTTMEVTSEDSVSNESVRVLHNYTPTLKKVYMRRLLQVLQVTHERYDAQLCWAPCVVKPKETFVMTSAVAARIQEIKDSWANVVPPEGTLSIATPADKEVFVTKNKFHEWADNRDINPYVHVDPGYKLASVHGNGDHNQHLMMPGVACEGGKTKYYPNPIGRSDPSVEIWVHLGKPYGANMDAEITAVLTPTQALIDQYNLQLQIWRDAQAQTEIDAYLASLQESAPDFAWSPHSAMRAVIKENFAGDGTAALPDLSQNPGCPLIEKMHALFEWENMSIRFFPPAWSRVDDYERPTTVENASAAKVFVPIRRGMEAEAVALLQAYGAIPEDGATATVIQTSIDQLNALVLADYARRYAPVANEDDDILAPNNISLTERGERVWRNAFEEEAGFQVIDRFITTLPTDGVDFEEAVSACPIPYPAAQTSAGTNGASGNGTKDSHGDDKDDKDDDKDDDQGEGREGEDD